jgi:hypothetical protein
MQENKVPGICPEKKTFREVPENRTSRGADRFTWSIDG